MVQQSIHYSGSKSFKLWGIFPQNCRFQTEKNSVIFLNYRPPYFCQNCELQMKKLKSYFGQNWGSQTEIKKYRLISVKTVYFWRK